ncbi:MAG: TRAP transporter substrate-binding protein [Bradymonadia bacterium]
MFKRTALKALTVGALALGLSAMFAANAQAEDEKIVLKIATVAPNQTPWTELLKRYRKAVKKASNGKVKVKIYAGGVKGDEQSIVRQTFKGKLQGAAVSTGAMATIVKELELLELPFLFENNKEVDSILHGPALPIVQEILEAKGFKLLILSENGFRSWGAKGTFIKSPADLKARKMRSQESAVHLNMYRALGASPVAIAVSEVQSSLKTGVVDGFDNTLLFTQAVGWQQSVDHWTESRHIYQPAVVAINKEWLEAQPADVQEAILAPGMKMGKKSMKAIRALGPALLKNMEAQGIKTYTLTEAERGAFKKLTRPTWDKARNTASELGKKLLDTIIKAKGG